MSNITPGPWKVATDYIDEEKSLDYLAVETDGATVARGILIDADARLIAAAPAMKDSLKRIALAAESMAVSEQELREWIANEASSALAKTTGSES